jgi:hypothetical protein
MSCIGEFGVILSVAKIRPANFCAAKNPVNYGENFLASIHGILHSAKKAVAFFAPFRMTLNPEYHKK